MCAGVSLFKLGVSCCCTSVDDITNDSARVKCLRAISTASLVSSVAQGGFALYLFFQAQNEKSVAAYVVSGIPILSGVIALLAFLAIRKSIPSVRIQQSTAQLAQGTQQLQKTADGLSVDIGNMDRAEKGLEKLVIVEQESATHLQTGVKDLQAGVQRAEALVNKIIPSIRQGDGTLDQENTPKTIARQVDLKNNEKNLNQQADYIAKEKEARLTAKA